MDVLGSPRLPEGPDDARLMGAEVQFRALGRKDARELAVALIAAYEGIALFAATLRDPGLIGAEGDLLNRWIDSLAEARQASLG